MANIYFFRCSGFPEFGKYLNQTGRPIVYSCSWPYYQELKGMIVSILELLQCIFFVDVKFGKGYKRIRK